MKTTNAHASTRILRSFITVIVLCTTLFSLSGCSKKDPREDLDAAYQKTFVDDNPMESVLGLTELTTKLNENAAHSAGYSFTIQEISGKGLEQYAGFLSGLGFSVDRVSDLLNRKSIATLDITYAGTTCLTLGGQIQGSELFFTVPQLLNSSVTVDLATMQEDLTSDSMVAQLLKAYEISLPENLFAELSQALTATSESTEDLLAAWEALDAALLVEKLGKKEISLPENVTAKHVYKVTIPKQAYVDFMNAYFDYSEQSSALLKNTFAPEEEGGSDYDFASAKEEFRKLADSMGDIVVNVAVTKNGYINYMTSTVTAGEDTATYTATFTGTNAPLEACKLVADATLDGKAYHFDLVQEFNPMDKEIDITAKASEDNTRLFFFDCVGTFANIQKGEKFALDLDYVELEYGTDFSLSLAGDCYVDTTACNITAPVPSERNLLRMSEADYAALLQEIESNLEENLLLSTVFKMLDFGISIK